MIKQSRHLLGYRLAIALLLLAGFSIPGTVSAAQLTSRSLTLGSSAATASTTHKFDFTLPDTDNLGSIKFEYCTTASDTCDPPTDLNVDGVSLDAQSGATGFSVDATTTTASVIGITRTPASASGAVSYTFSSAVNPSTTNTSFFVRITTYEAANFTTADDSGVVAASTANQIQLTGALDESLVFCVGETITGTDCGTIGGDNLLDFGTFSTTATRTATSVMAASTNAQSGYVITVSGDTLTSGTNTITALGSPTASATGSEQFGINLKDNATPNVGAEVSPSPNGTTLRGQASADYDTADQFKYVSGNQVAASDNGGAGSTDAQTYTVSYIVNIAGSSEAGTYTATLTYICTTTY